MAQPHEAHPKHSQDEFITAAVAGSGLTLAIIAGMWAAFGTDTDNLFGLGLNVNTVFYIGVVLVAIGAVLWLALTHPWKQFDDLETPYYTGHHDHDHHDSAHDEALQDTETTHITAADVVNETLTVIEGIGPKVESLLKEAGITSFAQLAASSPDDLKAILKAAKLHVANPTSWPRQAQYLVDGDQEGFLAYTAELRGGVAH